MHIAVCLGGAARNHRWAKPLRTLFDSRHFCRQGGGGIVLADSALTATRRVGLWSMPDPLLEQYLAEHYYSGPKADAVLKRYGEDGKKKKKKRKHHTENNDALIIKDDSAVWFGDEPEAEEAEDDVVAEAIPDSQYLQTSGSTSKPSGWVNVRQGAPQPTSNRPPSRDQPTSGSLEGMGMATGVPETSMPKDMARAESPVSPAPAPIKAGLMSGAQLRAQREAREAAERAEREREAAEFAEKEDDIPAHQETVYRDASGRRIDLAEEEARIREEHLRAERKKREREQWNQGLVQRREREEQRRELDRMQKEGVARCVL